MEMTAQNTKSRIASGFYRVIERLGGMSDMLSIAGSYGDTLTDEQVADELEAWLAANPLRPQPSGETREAVAALKFYADGFDWHPGDGEAPDATHPGSAPTYYEASAKEELLEDAGKRARDAILALLSTRPLALGGQQGAVADIIDERRRQVESEGWSVENDDKHDDCSLAHAAAAYALGKSVGSKLASYQDDVSGGRGETAVWGVRKKQVPIPWPSSWDARWWKPSNRRRDLVKAGALIVAEIERLDRAEGAK